MLATIVKIDCLHLGIDGLSLVVRSGTSVLFPLLLALLLARRPVGSMRCVSGLLAQWP